MPQAGYRAFQGGRGHHHDSERTLQWIDSPGTARLLPRRVVPAILPRTARQAVNLEQTRTGRAKHGTPPKTLRLQMQRRRTAMNPARVVREQVPRAVQQASPPLRETRYIIRRVPRASLPLSWKRPAPPTSGEPPFDGPRRWCAGAVAAANGSRDLGAGSRDWAAPGACGWDVCGTQLWRGPRTPCDPGLRLFAAMRAGQAGGLWGFLGARRGMPSTRSLTGRGVITDGVSRGIKRSRSCLTSQPLSWLYRLLTEAFFSTPRTSSWP